MAEVSRIARVAGAVTALAAALFCMASSNPPAPGSWQHNSPPQEQTNSAQTKSTPNQRLGNSPPLAVQVIPSPKTAQEARRRADKEFRDAASEWGTLFFTGLSTIIFFAQLAVFGLQARRLRQTVDAMKTIDARQASDIRDSIVAAQRSATAAEDSIAKSDQFLAHAQDTAVRQLRAYVLIDTVKIDNVAEGGIPVARVTIKNFGQTPAYNLTNWAIMGLDTFPPSLEEPPPQTSKEMGQTNIGPGATLLVDSKLTRALTQNEIKGLSGGQLAIFGIGQIRYDDGFNNERVTDYKFFCGGPIGISTRAMAPYSSGNQAT